MTITCINDFAKNFGSDVNHIERDIYKYTGCGAWITWDVSGLTIGSIVEGSDAEFDKLFTFPFDSSATDEWLDELERLTYEAWRDANNTYDEEVTG